MACSISPVISPIQHSHSSKFFLPILFLGNGKINNKKITIRAMVQQAVQGSSAAYAKEMERLSTKESLLLAVKFLLSFILSIIIFHHFFSFSIE